MHTLPLGIEPEKSLLSSQQSMVAFNLIRESLQSISIHDERSIDDNTIRVCKEFKGLLDLLCSGLWNTATRLNNALQDRKYASKLERDSAMREDSDFVKADARDIMTNIAASFYISLCSQKVVLGESSASEATTVTSTSRVIKSAAQQSPGPQKKGARSNYFVKSNIKLAQDNKVASPPKLRTNIPAITPIQNRYLKKLGSDTFQNFKINSTVRSISSIPRHKSSHRLSKETFTLSQQKERLNSSSINLLRKNTALSGHKTPGKFLVKNKFSGNFLLLFCSTLPRQTLMFQR